jgi:hypothetical protein
LQNRVHEVIAHNALDIGPHELQLGQSCSSNRGWMLINRSTIVTSVQNYWRPWESYPVSLVEDTEGRDPDDEAVQSDNETDSAADTVGHQAPVSEKHSFPRRYSTEKKPPPVYIFKRDSGHERNPCLSCLRLSFKKQPHWLDAEESFWLDDDEVRMLTGGKETKEGFELQICRGNRYVRLYLREFVG